MNFGLLLQFTRQDFVDRYSGSVLGSLWALIHPLMLIIIFTVVFANVMAVRLPGMSSAYSYGIYLVAGLLPWMAFANTINRCSTIFLDKRHIISKIRVSLPTLPLYVLISEVITFLIGYLLFLAFLVFSGALPGQVLLVVPFVFLTQQVFAFGLGLIFAILNVFLRDIKEMVGVLVLLWFWMTPIVWVLDIVPPWVQALQQSVNPAYLFIDAYHRVMVHGQLPDLEGLMLLVLIGHGVLFGAYFLLRWLERDIRDFV